ncbi:NUDIX domain-containing protein [Kytococcus sedentarius]|uniref:NUDIX hydrolase n=1 Tax=Kytococcus sedentarius TaxID=1276 RepID=UPI00384BA0FD
MEKTRTRKVVCYVTCGRHLLVITHLDVPLVKAGVQVPAGSVEEGESPQDAALREVREETGITGVSLVGRVGTDAYDVSPTRSEVQHRSFVHLVTDADITARWEAGEKDPSTGGNGHRWECWWLPLEDAHVLAAAQGRFIHRVA